MCVWNTQNDGEKHVIQRTETAYYEKKRRYIRKRTTGIANLGWQSVSTEIKLIEDKFNQYIGYTQRENQSIWRWI